MNQHRENSRSRSSQKRLRFTAGLGALALALGGLGLFAALPGNNASLSSWSPGGWFHGGHHDGDHSGGDYLSREELIANREYMDHGSPQHHHGGDGEYEADEVDDLEENEQLGPFPEDFVDILEVEPNSEPIEAGAEGTFRVECGRNENGLRNSENVIVSPGTPNAAQHTHDYVGNQRINEFTEDIDTNNQILLEGETTCENGDQSMHYWPVLRDITQEGPDADQPGGGLDGNVGDFLVPDEVIIEYRGNAQADVQPAPQFLQIFTGNARAASQGVEESTVQWTCTGFTDRVLSDKYPLCPEDSDVMRVFDFASCWDGANIESEDNRSHIFFPEEDGSCAEGTVPVPQLRQILIYGDDVPEGPNFAIDSFPEERHAPITDHSDHIMVMSDELMQEVVDCINTGQVC